VKLRIQSKDIRGAKRDCFDHCPIARAIRRSFPGNNVQVFDRSILVNGYDFEHTAESRDFAEAWNEGEIPYAQTIEIPNIKDRLRKAQP
jgi:hypothetical protein